MKKSILMSLSLMLVGSAAYAVPVTQCTHEGTTLTISEGCGGYSYRVELPSPGCGAPGRVIEGTLVEEENGTVLSNPDGARFLKGCGQTHFFEDPKNGIDLTFLPEECTNSP